MKCLTVDTRMLFSSGIGSYLAHLLPEIITGLENWKINLLGDVERIRECDWVARDNVNLIPCHAGIYSLSEQWELLRRIPADTDLFWSPHYNIPLFYRGRQVTTVHDIFHIADENEKKSFFKNVYARTMFKQVLKKSRIVLVDSEFTLSEMKKYDLKPLDKVKVIRGGANFEPQREMSEAVRTEGRHILYVGNVKPHKNLRRLAAAYKILREKYGISLPLVIAGETERFKTGMPGFNEAISESSQGRMIKLTGRVSDEELFNLYEKASLLVLPSIYEGFGLPPLEAMAFGCPVVVSKAASLPEICGEAALYIDPLDVEDMAEKMFRALTDETLRKDLILKGFDRLKLYDWKKAAFEYIQCFISIF
jgi:glycosyltransferase involved in cell wall biosynthesis